MEKRPWTLQEVKCVADHCSLYKQQGVNGEPGLFHLSEVLFGVFTTLNEQLHARAIKQSRKIWWDHCCFLKGTLIEDS